MEVIKKKEGFFRYQRDQNNYVDFCPERGGLITNWVSDKKEILYFDKNRFNIYLTHKPSLFNILNSSGLVLSGHTHNGQIFPFNLIVKLKFPHVYGFFKKGNTDLYVSSGSGCWGPRMRLGSNNEIIILEFI